MKTIYFEQIADSRFCDNTANEITQRHNKLMEVLQKENIECITSGIADFIDWKDGTHQHRIAYKIPKTMEHTYKKIFSTVNAIRAVPYKIK